MNTTAKPLPDANTLVNFGIATIRTREGHTARRQGWDKNSRLEPINVAGKDAFVKATYKATGKLKDKVLVTDADTQAVDWMINQ